TSVAYLEDLVSRPLRSREEVGLVRADTLLGLLGHPERAFHTIQVAGTTGKGSTTTMAAAILRQAGQRTGAFVSPHLQHYRERIAVDGTPIDEASWVRLLQAMQPALALMEANEVAGYAFGRAAFLEVLWAMACLFFAEQGVRCVVVETGMGGRLDPTTVNAARVAVITNVSLDHVERLGYTVEAIAAEKAALIKPDQIVISAAGGSALTVIGEVCRRRNATLWAVGPTGAARVESASDLPGAPFTVITPVAVHANLEPAMLGAHQRLNAACAVAAVDALVQQTGLRVPEEAVEVGLHTARIAGRMERIAGQPELLLDGAHNAAGAAALEAELRTREEGRRIVLLLGILGDKDMAAIADRLTPLAAAVVVSEPPWQDRAGFGAIVAEHARRHASAVEVVADPAAALARARALAHPDDLVVVAGSLYLVGAVRDALGSTHSGPGPA
ncbi:MAG TPA: Mur ligase family protein, partial [Chloroflexota bacterium]|nr:Mur ligase family protein [Chloroflexota bacterium]